MGTLGQYLLNARLAKNIDLRDAAQQTRISIQYLKALENEDFSKLPGEVFVKGFLRNYGRFLNLDESEVMKKYSQLKPRAASPSAPTPDVHNAVAPGEREETRKEISKETSRETPIEPFVWGAVILILLLVFLFSSLPSRPSKNNQQPAGSAVPAVLSRETASAQGLKQEKLYLEVVAIEDTWLLVRTDDSPQKKAVLKRGDSLTWSADERFLLSYGSTGALKLVLNGGELTVNGQKDAVVRDLVITRAGVLNQPAPARQAKPTKPKQKPQPVAEPQQPQPQQPQLQGVQKPVVPRAPSPPAPVQAKPLAPVQPAE